MFEVGDKVRSTIDSKAMGAEWRAVIVQLVVWMVLVLCGRHCLGSHRISCTGSMDFGFGSILGRLARHDGQ